MNILNKFNKNIEKFSSELVTAQESQSLNESNNQEAFNNAVHSFLVNIDTQIETFLNNFKSDAKKSVDNIYDGEVKSKLNEFRQNLFNVVDESNLDENLIQEIAYPLAQEIYDAIFNLFATMASNPNGPYYYLNKDLFYPTCQEYVFPYVNYFMYFLVCYTIILLLIIYFFKN